MLSELISMWDNSHFVLLPLYNDTVVTMIAKVTCDFNTKGIKAGELTNCCSNNYCPIKLLPTSSGLNKKHFCQEKSITKRFPTLTVENLTEQ